MPFTGVTALDLSLRSAGVCSLNAYPCGNDPFIQLAGERTIESTLAQGPALIDEITKGVAEWIDLYKPQLVPIEGYAYGFGASKATNNLTQLAELAGNVKVMLYRKSIPYLIVSPTAVKKFALGKGSGAKQDMKLAVFQKWGQDYLGRPDDLPDAYTLARIGLAYLGAIPCQHKYEEEVLKELRKEAGK